MTTNPVDLGQGDRLAGERQRVMETKSPVELAVEALEPTTLDDAMATIRSLHEAEQARAERFRETLSTLLVNSNRDAAATAPYVAPLCEAALAGKTVHEALAALQPLPVREEGEERGDYPTNLSSAKRADHEGERSAGDDAAIWRVCRTIQGDCQQCPQSEEIGGDECVRGCRLQAVECLNVVETGNPWRKTADVRAPWAVLPQGPASVDVELAREVRRVNEPLPSDHDGERSAGGCVNHPERPIRTNLDGEDLCQECADAWARGEGQAAAERACPKCGEAHSRQDLCHRMGPRRAGPPPPWGMQG